MRTTSLIRAAAATAGALLLAGCSSGPADVTSGEYRAFAASAEVGATPDVALTVVDGSYTFTPSTGPAAQSTTRPGTTEYVLCPPDGMGTPILLGAALTLGGSTLQQPAVFGDCGQATPKRITVVDLVSASTQVAPMPFTRWIEFCATTDPDC